MRRRRRKNIGIYQNWGHLSMTVGSAVEMEKLGGEVANSTHQRVWLFRGNLGAGKTTFVRGALRSLGVRHRVASPTFALVHRYPLRDKRWSEVVHVDLYRLRSRRELAGIGWHEFLHDPKVLVMIEWPARARERWPSGVLRVAIRHSTRGRLVRVTTA